MLFRNIRKIWRPELFQGKPGTKGYFEGWYFKLADKDTRNLGAVIPGVSFDRKGQDPHCFIQFLDSTNGRSYFFRYGIDTFSYADDRPEIKVGNSAFRTDGITLDIDEPEAAIKGKLAFSGLHPWPVTPFSPGAMGWYSFVPFMECYHGVISFSHRIDGHLELNGKDIDFTGGKGYMEKDWGKSFPGYHVWLQTNHFSDSGTSLMASVANIPWLGSYFDGFLIGLLYREKVYRFTTYTGAKITRFERTTDGLTLHVESKRHALEIQVSNAQGQELKVPVVGAMEGRLSESLSAEAQVRFYEKGKGSRKLLFEDTGSHAGLEIEGNLPDKLKL